MEPERAPVERQRRGELRRIKIDVFLISEPHFYVGDADKLILPGHEHANHQSRKDAGDKICGGVLMCTREELRAAKLNSLLKPALPITTCSILLHVQGNRNKTLRVPAVYIPPSKST